MILSHYYVFFFEEKEQEKILLIKLYCFALIKCNVQARYFVQYHLYPFILFSLYMPRNANVNLANCVQVNI